MLVVAAKLRAVVGKEYELERLICRVASKVHQNERDTLMYIPHRKILDPSEFFIYEQYRDTKALEVTHLSTPYYREMKTALPRLLQNGIEATRYEILEVA